jgi:hypothetical protein
MPGLAGYAAPFQENPRLLDSASGAAALNKLPAGPRVVVAIHLLLKEDAVQAKAR